MTGSPGYASRDHMHDAVSQFWVQRPAPIPTDIPSILAIRPLSTSIRPLVGFSLAYYGTSVEVTGDVAAEGDVTADGISLKDHLHDDEYTPLAHSTVADNDDHDARYYPRSSGR